MVAEGEGYLHAVLEDLLAHPGVELVVLVPQRDPLVEAELIADRKGQGAGLDGGGAHHAAAADHAARDEVDGAGGGEGAEGRDPEPYPRAAGGREGDRQGDVGVEVDDLGPLDLVIGDRKQERQREILAEDELDRWGNRVAVSASDVGVDVLVVGVEPGPHPGLPPPGRGELLGGGQVGMEPEPVVDVLGREGRGGERRSVGHRHQREGVDRVEEGGELAGEVVLQKLLDLPEEVGAAEGEGRGPRPQDGEGQRGVAGHGIEGDVDRIGDAGEGDVGREGFPGERGKCALGVDQVVDEIREARPAHEQGGRHAHGVAGGHEHLEEIVAAGGSDGQQQRQRDHRRADASRQNGGAASLHTHQNRPGRGGPSRSFRDWSRTPLRAALRRF